MKITAVDDARIPEPEPVRAAVVILGASGDLAKRKLIPALSALREQRLLSPDSIVMGEGRTPFSDGEFRSRFDVCCDFEKQLYYHRGITGLKKRLEAFGSYENTVIFLALPPSMYPETVKELYEEGFRGNERIVIEKPFGTDYESAKNLNKAIHAYYDESSVYRSDHYLAKEAVQNLLIFRFGNTIFEPCWNRHYIESIQINAFESIGVEERGAYFDSAGAVKDMVQNHLLQMLCLTAMDPPVSLDPEDIRAQKINILKALEFRRCVKGQYEGYLNEKNVAPGSTTETWAEIELAVNNHRWAGVPVYIRTGKALDRKGTEIGIKFRKTAHRLYNPADGPPANEIVFKVQPQAGIFLHMNGKSPGMEFRLGRTDMVFCYSGGFNGIIPEAYQKLLLDALRGDRTLFVSAEETETAWMKLEEMPGSGGLFTYERGKVPESAFGGVWIDFEKYNWCR